MSWKEALKRQIRNSQHKLDPEIRRRADIVERGDIPYDREAAREAIDRFLEGRPDGDWMRREITRMTVKRD